MNPIEIGISLLFAGFFISGLKLFMEGQSFNSYLKKTHPDKWMAMTEDLPTSKFIMFFSKGSLPYFIYKSDEDWGDIEIARRKKNLKRGFHFLCLYLLVFLVFVAVLIFLLSTSSSNHVEIKWFQ
jgi:hypothetical protein